MMQAGLTDLIILVAIILAVVFLILGYVVCFKVCSADTQEERDRIQTHDAIPRSLADQAQDEDRRKRIKQKYYA
ncbi:MAG: hypothetical protein ACW976_06690 [Candidatus Ranarchaeia archaeon]|jgi:hypothetical protein